MKVGDEQHPGAIPREMRTLGTWLTDTDAAILELLTELDAELPPAVIHHNLGIDRSVTQVHRRLKPLRDAGLVERLPETDGYYRLSDLGRDVVDGNLSREEINKLKPQSA